MYVLVRTDLPPAYQCVQASHAAILAARQSMIQGEHPSLVVCGLPHQKALLDASAQLERLGVKHSLFFEDDVQSYTALCTQSVAKEQRKAFRNYKLL